ncbi:MAG TPA: tryptophan synthase subunit alpha [Vicinamibacterales bacterium]|nr:tryptophan synthase subunit alpha [Acidobacteriota bacterium]HQX82517.1 tryptophan synthase subunit alpha [Vicinamibacterales bacterium]
MSRLEAAFARLRDPLAKNGEPGLVAYITAGDPDFDTSCDIVRAIARGGADVIEIGVPFSDPIADGPVIQRASERALAAGGSLASALELVRCVRADIDTPIVLFTYVNPVLRMGTGAFVAAAAEAGVDGALMLDLPIEESDEMHDALNRAGLDQIFLISPTTAEPRLRRAAELGRGFLYAISRLGVTGTSDAVSHTARPVVDAIRAVTDMPVALGFGIGRPEHVREACEYADAAVVGSALVQIIADAGAGQAPADAERFVGWLKGRMP